MKQPKIRLFGEEYKVLLIEFGKDGLIDRIVFQVNENQHNTVFRENEMLNKDLVTKKKITKPTKHPYHDYIYAPDLESLIVSNE